MICSTREDLSARLRKQVVEPVIGQIKSAGLEKVRQEWGLVCLASNLRNSLRRAERPSWGRAPMTTSADAISGTGTGTGTGTKEADPLRVGFLTDPLP